MTASTLTQPTNEQARALFPNLAVSALASTIALILMGSIVRVTGYGLGCPDWPLCYGQAIPPALTGAWVEFTHRLVGAAASIQIVLLGVLAWRQRRAEKWVFWPAVAAVALLVFQIGLGGLHVIMEIPPQTGLIHTGVAMLIVGLIAVVTAAVLPAFRRLQRAGRQFFREARFAGWVSGTTGAVYLLLLTGSYVTRSGASLVCPLWPACGAQPGALPQLVFIQLLHRYTAYTVAVLTAVIIAWLLRKDHDLGLNRYAYALAILLTLQIGLGIANILLRLPMWTRALHLTVGSTLWVAMVGLWVSVRLGRATSSPK